MSGVENSREQVPKAERTWSTRSELRHEIITWIERNYHRRRRQRALGKLTPIEFELAFAASEAA